MQGFTRDNLIAGLVATRTPGTHLEPEMNMGLSARSGQSMTVGSTQFVKGDWQELIALTANDAYAVALRVFRSNLSLNNRTMLTDIGIGTAGNEQVIIPDILTGAAGPSSTGNFTGPKANYFPGIFIPAGSRVVQRSAANTTAIGGAMIVVLDTQTKWGIQVSDVKQYGAISASAKGTQVVLGNGAFGSWTLLGSGTLREHRGWTLQMGLGGSATTTAQDILAQLGYGPSVNSVSEIAEFWFELLSQESIEGPFPWWGLSREVGSGQNIYVRGAGLGSTVDFIAYGS